MAHIRFYLSRSVHWLNCVYVQYVFCVLCRTHDLVITCDIPPLLLLITIKHVLHYIAYFYILYKYGPHYNIMNSFTKIIHTCIHVCAYVKFESVFTGLFYDLCLAHIGIGYSCLGVGSFVCITGHIGLGVGSWSSNRATEGSNPK